MGIGSALRDDMPLACPQVLDYDFCVCDAFAKGGGEKHCFRARKNMGEPVTQLAVWSVYLSDRFQGATRCRDTEDSPGVHADDDVVVISPICASEALNGSYRDRGAAGDRNFLQLAIRQKRQPLPVGGEDGSADGAFGACKGLALLALQVAQKNLTDAVMGADERYIIPRRGKGYDRSLQSREPVSRCHVHIQVHHRL